ncbi:hypothetical protein [Phenylobacterium sp.]|uniref:hypothetical protein n=1 Tax=Phenylobacterium sp. TaxID=1871053 RepID=UPI0027349B73|nr:hypothetical protein [Phenylobacterium sp.]MDP3852154.1 hypothetical protein [Phenylobacterium sp.]
MTSHDSTPAPKCNLSCNRCTTVCNRLRDCCAPVARRLNLEAATVAHAVARRCTCAISPHAPTHHLNETAAQTAGIGRKQAMKYMPLVFAAACLAGALTIVIVAPANAAPVLASSQVSQAISAPSGAVSAEIRTADPAKKPG